MKKGCRVLAFLHCNGGQVKNQKQTHAESQKRFGIPFLERAPHTCHLSANLKLKGQHQQCGLCDLRQPQATLEPCHKKLTSNQEEQAEDSQPSTEFYHLHVNNYEEDILSALTFKGIFKVIYLFMAVLGLRCRTGFLQLRRAGATL